MTDQTSMEMWTVYDHPRDFPNNYVARCWLITPGGPVATDGMIICPDLEKLRAVLASWGLTRMTRSDEDDPVIKETWL